MGNQATALRPEVLSDLSETTAFDADEIRDFYKTFLNDCSEMRMSLSPEEFKEMYTKVFPEGDSSKFAEYVFKHFDKNGDGRVDFREFLGNLSITLKGSLEERLAWLFNLYDIDNTGTIDRNELSEMVMSVHKLKSGGLPKEDSVSPSELVEYIMKKADTSKDGKLSREEFMNGALESKTIQRMLVGTLAATSSPFTKRKLLGGPKPQ